MSVRKKLVKFASTNVLIQQLKYGFKIGSIFIGVLFVDTISRLLRETEQRRLRKEGKLAADYSYSNPQNELTKLFYTQRNVYLTGVTLFFLIVNNRVYMQLTEIVELATKNQQLESQLGKLPRPPSPTLSAGSDGEPPKPPPEPLDTSSEKKDK